MNKVIALSGGFDPIHSGHVRMIQEAALLGRVHIYLNTDEWLKRKKGYIFMDFQQRAQILWAIKGVEMVLPALDADDTVCESLRTFKPDMFGNGGDRNDKTTPEADICAELGIDMVYELGGGKVESSSRLVKNVQH